MRMWAQLITMRVNDSSEGGVSRLLAHLRAIEQADSGWIRTIAMRDQAEPQQVSVLAVFESEEKARARESDPRRAEGLATLRAMMAELLVAPPEFRDLVVIEDSAP
jgi:quinol monooxygenase YgiN